MHRQRFCLKASAKKTFWVRVATTVIIASIYMTGRKIPLPFVNMTAYREQQMGPEFFWLNATGAFSAGYSLFALGLMPYVWGSMIVLLLDAIWTTNRRIFVSPHKMKCVMIIAALGLALPMTINRVSKLSLQASSFFSPHLVQILVGLTMLLGVLAVIALADLNTEYGIGGQTILILINVAETLFQTIWGNKSENLRILLILAIFLVAIELIMENSEMKIQLLRVSVHNLHAKENYLAIKWNPVGIMPMVFASVAFTLPSLLFQLLLLIRPQNKSFSYFLSQLTLPQPTGLIVYAALIFLLEYVFAAVFLRVDDQVENLLQTGDCIEGIRPGKETARYLKIRVFALSTLSAAVMNVCVLLPILVGTSYGITDYRLLSLPSTLILFACMCSNIIRDVTAAWKTEHYQTNVV